MPMPEPPPQPLSIALWAAPRAHSCRRLRILRSCGAADQLPGAAALSGSGIPWPVVEFECVNEFVAATACALRQFHGLAASTDANVNASYGSVGAGCGGNRLGNEVPNPPLAASSHFR